MAYSIFSLAPERLWQEINPWNFTAGQMGFINVYNEDSADRDLELRIVHDVAGYGRQLGRIGEAMQVLISLMKSRDPAAMEQLDAASKQALQDFGQMMDRIEATKAAYGASQPAPKPAGAN